MHSFRSIVQVQDSLNQFISPDAFIEIAVYTNDLAINGTGRIPISMDWEKRRIILPPDTTTQYFYLAIYIDRNYINSKVIEFTKANKNRVIKSNSPPSMEPIIRARYDEIPYVEEQKSLNTNFPKVVPVKRKPNTKGDI